jgi:hypothetical protein
MWGMSLSIGPTSIKNADMNKLGMISHLLMDKLGMISRL